MNKDKKKCDCPWWVDAEQHQRNSIIKESFSKSQGASTEKIKKTEGLLESKPSVLIVYAGTNDLSVTSAEKPLLKMCHLRNRLRRIFLFRRKALFHSQNIQVFVFLTIPWYTRQGEY